MKTRIPLYAKTLGAELLPPCPRSIATNDFPHSLWLAFDSIWVCSNGATGGQAAVERFDRLTGTNLARIYLGSYSQHNGHGICDGGEFIWACDYGSGEVVKIAPATNQIVARIAVGNAPRHVCEVNGFVWVTVSGDNVIKKIDPATNQIVATVAVGSNPYRMCWGGADILWVGCIDSNQVYKIDTSANSVALTISANVNQPWTQFYDGTFLYVVNYGSSTISLYDATGAARGWWVLTPGGPHDLVVVGHEMWVTLSAINQVECIDMLTGAASRTIGVNADPAGMIFDGESVWHTCAMANLVLRHQVRTLFE